MNAIAMELKIHINVADNRGGASMQSGSFTLYYDELPAFHTNQLNVLGAVTDHVYAVKLPNNINT